MGWEAGTNTYDIYIIKLKRSIIKYLYSITFLPNWIERQMIVNNEIKWISFHHFLMNFILNCKIQIIVSCIFFFHSLLIYLLITYLFLSFSPNLSSYHLYKVKWEIECILFFFFKKKRDWMYCIAFDFYMTMLSIALNLRHNHLICMIVPTSTASFLTLRSLDPWGFAPMILMSFCIHI